MSSPLTLRRVCTVIPVLRFIRVTSVAEIINIANISATFRDTLESYSSTFWRRLASHLEISALAAFFKRDEFAWIAYNLLTVGQLDVSRTGTHPLHVAARSGAAGVVRVCFAADPACVDVFDEFGWNALHLASMYDCAECARELLAAGIDITLTDGIGGTALHHAAQSGNGDVVRLLVAHADFEKIRDVRDGKGKTAKDLTRSDEVKRLLSNV